LSLAALILIVLGRGNPATSKSPQQSNSRKTRKVGDKLVIDGNITVEVVKISGNRISLGIVAPSNVKILRGELTEPQTKAQIVELVVEDGLLVAC
jgi:carbon storage regulator CsrA